MFKAYNKTGLSPSRPLVSREDDFKSDRMT